MNDRYDSLRLSNQLCFPIYLCAKEIVNSYSKPLARLNLSYTQYVIMMYLWENGTSTAKQLSDTLLLDQSTLTPLVKKLEAKGYISRQRCTEDERCILISLTQYGTALKEEALKIPVTMKNCLNISREDAIILITVIEKILKNIKENKSNVSY